MQPLSLMATMKLQIMMSKCITIQEIAHQIIEDGCMTNLVDEYARDYLFND